MKKGVLNLDCAYKGRLTVGDILKKYYEHHMLRVRLVPPQTPDTIWMYSSS